MMKTHYPPFRISRLIVILLFAGLGAAGILIEWCILEVVLGYDAAHRVVVYTCSVIFYVAGGVIMLGWKSSRDSAIWESGDIELGCLEASIRQELNRRKAKEEKKK